MLAATASFVSHAAQRRTTTHRTKVIIRRELERFEAEAAVALVLLDNPGPSEEAREGSSLPPFEGNIPCVGP